MNETDKKLKDYYREIHGYDQLVNGVCERDFVDDLIGSHRYLRSFNIKVNEERKKIMKDAYDAAYRDAAMMAIEQDWISSDKLRKMSVSELVELLRED
jgi:hypothetical protein